ncbi:MAG: amidohydrolase, partial [Acidobacteriota bacterium]
MRSIRLAPYLIALLVAALLAPASLAKRGKDAKKEKADAAAEETEEAWDVDNPPGEFYELELDTTTGTWMSLDVSPDGREIVFDLFGDLYRLPIEGGDAEALTQGFAWDMQPTYSPDGKSIAFTSDRGGGDNIWVMDLEGGDPVAVTSEDFRLLNSPAWSPDGNYLAARKHFTSRRSLGAGELWLYHKSGGKGLQLNEKPNDQKDLGEPAFSTDGRTIYFSQDTTPGAFFQYNKDPNGQIYTIQRLDRETGEIEPFITGAGGAIRPTPSPDGKSLAFIRRVRYQTTLFVHDLASGRNTPITDQLERDMQETWAVHGVYPTMEWTPDSREIVFWAGGKIHRVDVASGELREIPFRVRQTHKMVEALRFPIDVAPDTFHTKMLRWVEVSPDGSQVVFQALGHLYLRNLPDGEPQRLTTQHEHTELYPTFTRDGRSILYTTWHDENLGSVRIAPAQTGSTGRALTTLPGHYVEPTASPDGQTVVFRKAGGGFVRSPLYSHDQGLYSMRLEGGDPVRITKNGFRPHFGAANDRVYFTTFEPEDKRALRSIDLGADDVTHRGERTHLTSEAATEIRVSPDGQWVAFSERFNAYIAPFVAASKAINLGPMAASIPVSKVSRDTGEYLHWSGDSSTLHWSLGPELFTRPLNQAFAFLEGAPEELPEPAEKGVDIGFDVTADVPTGSVAFVGGRLITMNDDEVIEDGTVVVEGDRITAVGPSIEVQVPAGATQVDVSGHTLIPGLVDVHWHGAQGTSEIVPQRNWNNYATLAFGVTTIHDPSTDTSTFFAAAEMARAGLLTAPRLFSTGTILYGA